jgi:hypothetical protein
MMHEFHDHSIRDSRNARGCRMLELGSVPLPVVTAANGADGVSDVEGKVARVATSKLGNERVSIGRFIAEGGKGPYPDME